MRVEPIWHTRYDSAPQLMWNPLYRLADRAERARDAPPHILFTLARKRAAAAKAAAARKAADNSLL